MCAKTKVMFFITIQQAISRTTGPNRLVCTHSFIFKLIPNMKMNFDIFAYFEFQKNNKQRHPVYRLYNGTNRVKLTSNLKSY